MQPQNGESSSSTLQQHIAVLAGLQDTNTAAVFCKLCGATCLLPSPANLPVCRFSNSTGTGLWAYQGGFPDGTDYMIWRTYYSAFWKLLTTKYGYQLGVDLFAAPYDWRLSAGALDQVRIRRFDVNSACLYSRCTLLLISKRQRTLTSSCSWLPAARLPCITLLICLPKCLLFLLCCRLASLTAWLSASRQP